MATVYLINLRDSPNGGTFVYVLPIGALTDEDNDWIRQIAADSLNFSTKDVAQQLPSLLNILNDMKAGNPTLLESQFYRTPIIIRTIINISK